MINPDFIFEEKFDYLIIGDTINEALPSLEIQNWLFKFKKISLNNNLIIKIFSGFYVVHPDIKIEPFWTEFLQEHIKAEINFPPILSLKLKSVELTLENGSLDLVKAYSNDIINFIINNNKI